MQCNSSGIALIKQFEGCELRSYQDQNDVWTIGYGQTGPYVIPDMYITESQADMWLKQQLDLVSAALTRLIKAPINNNQFSAFCCLAYNIGISAFANSSALQLFNAGQVAEVPEKMLLWDHVNHIVDPGLTRRRHAEVSLFNTESA